MAARWAHVSGPVGASRDGAGDLGAGSEAGPGETSLSLGAAFATGLGCFEGGVRGGSVARGGVHAAPHRGAMTPRTRVALHRALPEGS